MKIRLHRFLDKTQVEGPGTRCCIWVQGCKRHCKGCAAKETWSFQYGNIVEVSDLYQRIINIKGIEGVTFVGGEPFEQAAPLYELGKKLKNIGLSIVVFTGYTYDEILKKGNEQWLNLLSITDLLIDGAFEEDKFDLSRPWVGSSNQNYRFLTSRYEKLERNLKTIKNKIEIIMDKNGNILINGMGDFKKIKEIFRS
ncbi:4Fe-4S single cluster domain-containing protein [Clostridium pasteurianum]|uniref:4Fe-4S single cluster domain-containing protein n=1 Tax=Clostridium pasteurianum TaxID=1501 RepID=UPI000826C434|nr:4Fe-4S single cluster domain-containing protein [Clostridium pasteurianum]PJI07520.1 ribonucleoside-triphosphate reductase activating protein [Clostridium sp. CT7]